MRRFFFHFNRQSKIMTLHFCGTCYQVVGIRCLVPCETKWNKRQPYLVMQGWAKDIEFEKGVATIYG